MISLSSYGQSLQRQDLSTQQTGNEKVASAAASTRLYWPPEGTGVDRILSKSEYSLLDRQKEHKFINVALATCVCSFFFLSVMEKKYFICSDLCILRVLKISEKSFY